MRFVAALLTLMTLAVAGWAGQSLYQELRMTPAATKPAAVQIAKLKPTEVAIPPRQWPALFGEPQPPAPAIVAPAPPTQEPQPPAPPSLSIEDMGYTLKGVVRINSGGANWALVSHVTGERLMRVGDILQDGLIVARIDGEGLWVSADGDDPQLLKFEQ